MSGTWLHRRSVQVSVMVWLMFDMLRYKLGDGSRIEIVSWKRC